MVYKRCDRCLKEGPREASWWSDIRIEVNSETCMRKSRSADLCDKCGELLFNEMISWPIKEEPADDTGSE